MYGWRARIGNISPTACAEIFPYEFYRVAPEGVTVVTTNLVIRDARESSEVEASWEKFDTVIENLVQTRVDYITLSGAPLVLAKGVERYRELLKELRRSLSRPRRHKSTGVCRWLEISRRDQARRSHVIYPGLQRVGESIPHFRRIQRAGHRDVGNRFDLVGESDPFAVASVSACKSRRPQVSEL